MTFDVKMGDILPVLSTDNTGRMLAMEMEEREDNLMLIMRTLQDEGWKWDPYGLTPEGCWRGWWYKPSDPLFYRPGNPRSFNEALRVAWRLRNYYASVSA